MANLTEKIISRHITDGEMKPGTEIGLKIDQTLTQDSTGTMAYLELEAMGYRQSKNKIVRCLYRPQYAAGWSGKF